MHFLAGRYKSRGEQKLNQEHTKYYTTLPILCSAALFRYPSFSDMRNTGVYKKKVSCVPWPLISAQKKHRYVLCNVFPVGGM